MKFRRLILLLASLLAGIGIAVGIGLDLLVPGWDDAAPFSAAIAQAILTLPITVLLTAVVFDRLLNLQLRARQKALRETLTTMIRYDASYLMDVMASQLFAPGARFPSAEHLHVVMAASLLPSSTETVIDDAMQVRRTGAKAVLREEYPIRDLRLAADRFDGLLGRYGRLAELDPDLLVLHEQCRLAASGNHLQLDRYETSDGRGQTGQLVLTGWLLTLVSIVKILASLDDGDRGGYEWHWPHAEGVTDLPRSELKEPMLESQWQRVQETTSPA